MIYFVKAYHALPSPPSLFFQCRRVLSIEIALVSRRLFTSMLWRDVEMEKQLVMRHCAKGETAACRWTVGSVQRQREGTL